MLSICRRVFPLAKATSLARTFARFKYKWDEEEYQKSPYEYSRDTHGTNAEELIHKVPVIEVEGDTARCMGVKEGTLGHPMVYIQLNTRKPGSIVPCPYCNLRYVKKLGHDKH